MRPSLRKHLSRRVTSLLLVLVMASDLIPFVSVQPVYACYSWAVGQRVGLKKGGEIRQGSSTGYTVHTIVPDDNWPVDITGGPRSANGQQWWDISRKNIDGGGTGWVSIQQAGFDVCGSGSGSPPAPQPQPQPQPVPTPSSIQLCEHDNYKGRCESFIASDPVLRGNAIGNDTTTSIRVPSGHSVALYEHDNYEGRCVTFIADNPNISNTPVGNDNVSSIQVDATCPSPNQVQTYTTKAVKTSVNPLKEHGTYGVFLVPTGHQEGSLRMNFRGRTGAKFTAGQCGAVGPGENIDGVSVPDGYIGVKGCIHRYEAALVIASVEQSALYDPSFWTVEYKR